MDIIIKLIKPIPKPSKTKIFNGLKVVCDLK